MPWTLVDSAAVGDAPLELYEKNGRFMIRAGGFELMNGFRPESETALGGLAAALAPAPEPRILVGGLGLGYTAAALLAALGGRGRVTVAELSAAVIDWFERHVRASVLPGIHGNLAILHADVAELLAAGILYDLVVLDVDNGPAPLVAAGNAALYGQEGLRALKSALRPNGMCLLWSGFESPEFEARAEQAGFAVLRIPFRRGRPELAHFIYLLARNRPVAQAALEQAGVVG